MFSFQGSVSIWRRKGSKPPEKVEHLHPPEAFQIGVLTEPGLPNRNEVRGEADGTIIVRIPKARMHFCAAFQAARKEIAGLSEVLASGVEMARSKESDLPLPPSIS